MSKELTEQEIAEIKEKYIPKLMEKIVQDMEEEQQWLDEMCSQFTPEDFS